MRALQKKGVLISYSRSRKTIYRLADQRILQGMEIIDKISQRKAKQADASKLHLMSDKMWDI